MTAFSHAYIIFTVLQVHLWVNDGMTFAEWPIFCSDTPAKCVTPPPVQLRLCTGLTPTHTIMSAFGIFLDPWHLPTSSKGHNPTCLSAGWCCEIIFGVSIEVATETTSLTGITARQRDQKIMLPVITDSQAKISLNDHIAAAL